MSSNNDLLKKLGIVWTGMPDQSEITTLEKELNAMKEFVSKNPYPRRNKILRLLIDAKLPEDFKQHENYTLEAHSLCKKIYENITDSKLIYNLMTELFFIGGPSHALANYYTLCNYTPLRYSVTTKSYAIQTLENLPFM